MRSDKGFSLIELIVVIAILSIVSAAAVMGYRSLSPWQVSKCISGIDSSLDKAKVTALSKSDAEFSIYKNSEGYHIKIITAGGNTEEENKLISGPAVTVSYTATDGSNTVIGEGEENALKLKFDRSSGAFKPIGTDSTDKSIYCTTIVAKLKSTSKTITLYYATGKHTVD